MVRASLGMEKAERYYRASAEGVFDKRSICGGLIKSLHDESLDKCSNLVEIGHGLFGHTGLTGSSATISVFYPDSVIFRAKNDEEIDAIESDVKKVYDEKGIVLTEKGPSDNRGDGIEYSKP